MFKCLNKWWIQQKAFETRRIYTNLLQEEKKVWRLPGQEKLKRGEWEHILSVTDQRLKRRRFCVRDLEILTKK